MYRGNRIALVCGATITLVLLSLLHISQTSRTSLLDLEQFEYGHRNANLFFSIILLGLLFLSYIKRRKKVRVVLSLFLGLLSCACWFSASIWYNVSVYEQRFIAIIFLGIGFWVLVSKSSKEKRKYFSQVVRREVIHKQKGKCARCKRKLVAYGFDVDHKNNNPSNNKLSNCQVLCVPCHRKKHTY